jgi:hypothetical protein
LTAANQFFKAVLLAQDKNFFAQCRAKLPPDWEEVRALCNRRGQSLGDLDLTEDLVQRSRDHRLANSGAPLDTGPHSEHR